MLQLIEFTEPFSERLMQRADALHTKAAHKRLRFAGLATQTSFGRSTFVAQLTETLIAELI